MTEPLTAAETVVRPDRTAVSVGVAVARVVTAFLAWDETPHVWIGDDLLEALHDLCAIAPPARAAAPEAK